MSDLDAEIVAAFAAGLDVAGDLVTYTPAGGSPAAITVLLGDVERRPVEEGGEEFEIERRTATVLASDVAGPARGDTIEADGETWAVEAVAGRCSAFATLELVAVDRRMILDPEGRAELPT